MKCTGSSFISWDCLGSTNISSSIEACSIRTWIWHRDDINVDEVFLFFPAYCPLASLYTSELPCHFRVDRKLVFESRNYFDFDSDEACRSVWNSADVIEGVSCIWMFAYCVWPYIYLFISVSNALYVIQTRYEKIGMVERGVEWWGPHGGYVLKVTAQQLNHRITHSACVFLWGWLPVTISEMTEARAALTK